MSANKRGLRATFHCVRVNLYVQPTGDIVEQRGQRWQRMQVYKRGKQPRFLWVPISATRWDIENMLEIEFFEGDKSYALPIVTDLAAMR